MLGPVEPTSVIQEVLGKLLKAKVGPEIDHSVTPLSSGGGKYRCWIAPTQKAMEKCKLQLVYDAIVALKNCSGSNRSKTSSHICCGRYTNNNIIDYNASERNWI